jgi:serine/threonine-protein kinase
MPPIRDSVITISLLDPVRGHAVQSWEFDGATVIRIGRAETNDVILNDSQVSRVHGELTRTDDGWNITPLGRNGVAINGRAINGTTPVAQETVLRLAANGPYLEFRIGRRQNSLAERLADEQRWPATRERMQERARRDRTDVTEIDFLKRREPQKPAIPGG